MSRLRDARQTGGTSGAATIRLPLPQRPLLGRLAGRPDDSPSPPDPPRSLRATSQLLCVLRRPTLGHPQLTFPRERGQGLRLDDVTAGNVSRCRWRLSLCGLFWVFFVATGSGNLVRTSRGFKGDWRTSTAWCSD